MANGMISGSPVRRMSQRIFERWNYYVVEEVQSTWRGMEIAIPAEDWPIFAPMPPAEFAQCLQNWAARVNLKRFRKSPRGPKKPKHKKQFDPKHPHVSTARLLDQK